MHPQVLHEDTLDLSLCKSMNERLIFMIFKIAFFISWQITLRHLFNHVNLLPCVLNVPSNSIVGGQVVVGLFLFCNMIHFYQGFSWILYMVIFFYFNTQYIYACVKPFLYCHSAIWYLQQWLYNHRWTYGMSLLVRAPSFGLCSVFWTSTLVELEWIILWLVTIGKSM